MLDSDIIRKHLLSRFAELQQTQVELEEAILSTADKIDKKTTRIGKRPPSTVDAIEKEMAQLEYYRSTTTMSLAKEKGLLREQEASKAKIRAVQDYAAQEDAVRELREKRAQLLLERSLYTEQLYEIQRGLDKLALADKAGVTVADLVTVDVHVPADKIGRVIGKQRAALAAVESECMVACMEHSNHSNSSSSSSKRVQQDVGSSDTDAAAAAAAGGGGGAVAASAGMFRISISGCASACAAAKARIEHTALLTDVTVPVDSDTAAALRTAKSALKVALAAEYSVKLDVYSVSESGAVQHASSKANSSQHEQQYGLKIHGVPDDIDRFKERLQALAADCTHKCVCADDKTLPAVIGAKGANLMALEQEHGVSIQLEKAKMQLLVQGTSGGVTAAAAALERVIKDNTECCEEVSLSGKTHLISNLLANQGEAFKSIQKEVGGGIMIKMDKYNRVSSGHSTDDSAVSISIKGAAARVHAAKALVQGLVASLAAQVATIVVYDSDVIKLIIGKGGASIKKIRARYPAVDVQVDSSKAIINVLPMLSQKQQNSSSSTSDSASGDTHAAAEEAATAEPVTGETASTDVAADVQAVKQIILDIIAQNYTEQIYIGEDAAVSLISRAPTAVALRTRITARKADSSSSNSSSVTSEVQAVEVDEENDDESSTKSTAAPSESRSEAQANGLGVNMRIDPANNGRVTLRGRQEAVLQAVELLEDFKCNNYTSELHVSATDGQVLRTARSAGDSSSGTAATLLSTLETDYNCRVTISKTTAAAAAAVHTTKHSSSDASSSDKQERDSAADTVVTVRIRGVKASVDKAIAAVRYMLYGDQTSAASASAAAAPVDSSDITDKMAVVIVALEEQAFGPLIGKGGSNIKKMSADLGVRMDAMPAASTLRITGDTAAAVSAARAAVMNYVANVRVTETVPLPAHLQSGDSSAAAAAATAETNTPTAAAAATPLYPVYGARSSKREAAQKAAAPVKPSKGQQVASDNAKRAKQAMISELRAVPRLFAVSCDVTATSVVLRGALGSMAAAKQHVLALITGSSTVRVQLTQEQAGKLGDVHCRRIASTSKSGDVHVYIDTLGSCLVITGPHAAVKVAKAKAYCALEFAFPGQFVYMDMPLAAVHSICSPGHAQQLSHSTGTCVTVDHECSCVRIRSSSSSSSSSGGVEAAVAQLNSALSQWRELHGIVKFEQWVLACMNGRGADRFLRIQPQDCTATAAAATECEEPAAAAATDSENDVIVDSSDDSTEEVADATEQADGINSDNDHSSDVETPPAAAAADGDASSAAKQRQQARAARKERVSISCDRAALEFHVNGSSAAAVASVCAQLRALLSDLEKEHANVQLPFEAIPRFVGKQGSCIKALQSETDTRVTIDSASGLVHIAGEESAVRAATARVQQFARDWEQDHTAASVAVPDRLFGAIIGKSGCEIRALQEKCKGVQIDLDREQGAVHLYGRAEGVACAHEHIQSVIDADAAQQAAAKQERVERARAHSAAAAAAAAAAAEAESAREAASVKPQQHDGAESGSTGVTDITVAPYSGGNSSSSTQQQHEHNHPHSVGADSPCSNTNLSSSDDTTDHDECDVDNYSVTSDDTDATCSKQRSDSLASVPDSTTAAASAAAPTETAVAAATAFALKKMPDPPVLTPATSTASISSLTSMLFNSNNSSKSLSADSTTAAAAAPVTKQTLLQLLAPLPLAKKSSSNGSSVRTAAAVTRPVQTASLMQLNSLLMGVAAKVPAAVAVVAAPKSTATSAVTDSTTCSSSDSNRYYVSKSGVKLRL